MSLTKVTYSMINGDVVNVLDYGADPTGATDSTTAIATAIAAGTSIYIPEGTYKCNILLTGTYGKQLRGASQGQGSTGTRLIPADFSKPVIDIVGWAVDTGIENLLIDSQLATPGYTHTGIGIRFKSASPAAVWRCFARHLFIRGFQDGLIIDCDINLSEVFDCDFQDIETIGCSRYSFKTRGVYNRFGKLFATQCGISGGTQPTADYAIYHDGSHCFFDSMVSDGRQYWAGTGNFVGIAVIESIYGPGVGTIGAAAIQLTGTGRNYWAQIRLNGVANAKYTLGVRVFGELQTIGNVFIEGVNYPATGFSFDGTSSGIIGNAEQSTLGIKVSQPANWKILGDTSTAIIQRYSKSPALPLSYISSAASAGVGTRTIITNASVTLTAGIGTVAAGSSTAVTSVVIAGTAGEFSCAASTLAVGQTIYITGTFGGTGSITGYTPATAYSISVTNGTTTFTLTNMNGTVLVTTAGTPTGLTYVVGNVVPVYSNGTYWVIG